VRKLIALTAALAAGLLLNQLSVPGAWFFAPLLITMLFAVRGGDLLRIPRPGYVAAQAVIGSTLGASASSVGFNPHYAGTIAVAVTTILLTSLFNGWFLTKITSLEAITAFLGTMPGGAGEMAAMSDSLGGDTRLVSVMQYARLLIILGSLFLVAPLLNHPVVQTHPVAQLPVQVLTGPDGWLLLITLAGFLAGTRTRIPAGAFLVPAILYILLASQGRTPGHWPYALLALAYATMGIRIGSQFERSTIQVLRGLVFPVVGTTVLLLSGSWLLAYWLTQRLNLDGASAYLAATPGGLDSVAAVATELHSNSGVILMIHFARLFSVLLIGPWLVRGGASILQRSAARRTSDEAEKVIVEDK
jgi:uncharacterized protein